ncbi:hypothetical protein J1N35_028921 [Gossypium stocksii]|uniref:Uncharacterized protein n=1 Tax=Gossypium stocksii TaxID=47602 RepID=A0A9D3UYU7_9ROSI|nr:hypothetical protein J1N35_028921 [Gossypium stocksii]
MCEKMDISEHAPNHKENEVELLFPHLVTALCRQAKVLMGRSLCVLQPNYVTKSGLKLPQFLVAKYKVKIEPVKTRKEEELEEVDNLEEDLKVESKGKTNKPKEVSDPDSDNFKYFH